MTTTERFAGTIPEGVDFAVATDGTAVPRQAADHGDLPQQTAGEAKTIVGDGWTMTDGSAPADATSRQPADPGAR